MAAKSDTDNFLDDVSAPFWEVSESEDPSRTFVTSFQPLRLSAIVTPRGPDEVVRDGVDGYLVPAGDPAAIIEALERLYADAELRLQLGRNARSQGERWSWARYASAAADSVLQGSAR